MSKWYSIDEHGKVIDEGGVPAPELHLPKNYKKKKSISLIKNTDVLIKLFKKAKR